VFVTSPFVLLSGLDVHFSRPLSQRKRYVFPFMFSTVLLFLSADCSPTDGLSRGPELLIDYGKQFQPMITIGEYTDLFLTIMIGNGGHF